MQEREHVRRFRWKYGAPGMPHRVRGGLSDDDAKAGAESDEKRIGPAGYGGRHHQVIGKRKQNRGAPEDTGHEHCRQRVGAQARDDRFRGDEVQGY